MTSNEDKNFLSLNQKSTGGGIVVEKIDTEALRNLYPTRPELKKTKSKLEDKQHFENQIVAINMARHLQATVETDRFRKRDFNYRWAHLSQEYEKLRILNNPLFMAALNGELYNGETGKLVQAFMEGGGDQYKTIEKINGYKDKKADDAIIAIDRIKMVNEQVQKERSNIQRIIDEYKASNSSGPQ
jgi:hypothetical protein